MGNWNPKYFEKKSGSLEEAILNAVNGVKSQLNEDSMDVNIDDDSRLFQNIEKMKVKIQILNRADRKTKDVRLTGSKNDINKVVDKFQTSMRSEDDFAFNEKMDAVGKEDGDIDNDGDKDASDKYLAKRRKTISKAIKNDESFEYGTPEATKNSLDMTPGQSPQEWDEQVGFMHKKHNTMREALAKMWGVEEGHNPFKKEQKTSKKENKTLTGKTVTKVSVNPNGQKEQ